MQTYQYEYISGPEVLNKYYQHGSVVSKAIQFVSVLTRIEYQKDDKTVFKFDNFTNGKSGLNTYTGKIKAKGFESDALLRMVLVGLTEKLGARLDDVNFMSSITIDEAMTSFTAIVAVKGLFITAYDNATLQIHELSVCDIKYVMKDGQGSVSDIFKPTMNKLLKNLLIREKQESWFKINRVYGYDAELREYIRASAREKPPLPKISRNPLFQLAAPSQTNSDSVNEFDSQIHSQQAASDPDESETDGEKPLTSTINRNIITQNDTVPTYHNVESIGLTMPTLSTGAMTGSKRQTIKEFSQEQNSELSKRIKVTELVNLTKRPSFNERQKEAHTDRQDLSPDIASYQLPYDSHPPQEPQQEMLGIFSAHGHSSKIKEISPHSLADVTIKTEHTLSDVSIVGFLPNSFVCGDLKELRDNELVLYIYSYNLPLESAVFIPEYNCYEVTVPYIAAFFKKLGIQSYPYSIKNTLYDFNELIGNTKFDLTLKKSITPFQVSNSYHWELRDLRIKSTIKVSAPLSQKEDRFPLVRVSDIIPTTISKYYTVIGLAMTVKRSGNKTVVLSFTDFTRSPYATYGYDSFLGSFSERIPETEHVHALIYLNRVEMVDQKLQSIIRMGLMECADKGNSNITHRSIIFRFTIKCQLYHGKMNTVILDADPITPQTPVSKPELKYLRSLRSKIFKRMPPEVLQLYKLTMSRFLPISKAESSDKQVLVNEQQVLTSGDDSDDPIQVVKRRMETLLENGVPDNDATLPLQLHGSRNPKILSIFDVKRLQEASSTDIKINVKILDARATADFIELQVTDDITEGTIGDPYKSLLKLQVWGTQNLTLFFGNPEFTNGCKDIVKCAGSILNLTIISRMLRINDLCFIQIWTPLYSTLESILIHSKLENDTDTLKYENTSDIE